MLILVAWLLGGMAGAEEGAEEGVWLRGRVLAADGAPVAGAHVRGMEGGGGCLSDSAGFFRLEVVLPVRLRVSHVGYREAEVAVGTGDGGHVADSVVYIVLEPLEHRLAEVRVQGRGEAGVAYTSRRDLQRMPAVLGEQDVLKYMALLPGVVRTNALDPGIYVRGGNSTDNAFLVNDIEVANPAHMTGILSVFDPWLLSRSRLYKSGYPARYAGYLSAYVNMEPVTLPEEAAGAAGGAGGTREAGKGDAGGMRGAGKGVAGGGGQGDGEFRGEATVGMLASALKYRGRVGQGNTTYSVSARASYLQYMAQLYNRAAGSATVPGYSFYDVTAALRTSWGKGWGLAVFGMFGSDRLRFEKDAAQPEAVAWGTLSLNANLSYRSGKQVVYGRFGYRSARTETDLTKSIRMQATTGRGTFSAEGEYRRYVNGVFHWSAGVRVEHTGWLFDGMEGWGMGDSRQALYTLYAQADWDFAPGWHLRAGVNGQHYRGKRRWTDYAPRVQVGYGRGGWRLWADAARTVQYEGQWTALNLKSPVDVWYPLAAGMRPATAWQCSVGAQREWEGGWRAYAALYWKRMRDLKDFASLGTTGDAVFEERLVAGDGAARGVEAEVAFDRPRYSLRANYTLSDAWCRFGEINGGRRFHPPYDIRHNVLAAVSVRPGGRWALNAAWTYASGTKATFPVGVAVAQNIHHPQQRPDFIPIYRERYNFRLPANHQLDVSADYTLASARCQWKWTAGVFNLYNRPNAALVYFEAEAYEQYYTRFVPHSRVLLPCVPYLSLTLNW